MAASLMTRTKAKVDLYTSKKVRGLIAGRGRSLFKGSGEDFDDLKYYQPGDKISDIDWKATARSGEPLIRQFNEERVRHLGVIADTSAAMAATAADGTRKKDAMVTAAGLLCFLAQSYGDLVSLVAGTPHAPLQLPGRSSRGHLELLLRSIDRSTELDGPPADFDWLLTRAARVTRRSTLFMVITDEAHPRPSDSHLLRRLVTRHDLMMVRIKDADPLARTHLDTRVVDPGAPRDLLPGTRRARQVQREADAFRAARITAGNEVLDSLRIPFVLTEGDTTVVDDIIDLLRRRGGARGRR